MLPNDDPDPAYEDLPYPSMTIQDTHPDHLAVMARFHDLVPRSPEKCRVLELGCGNGSNLNWMASTLPASEFVGVDLSKVHIDEACETHSKLGIGNAEFYEQNVLEIDEQEFGEFDYIIAHGLFSWVPEAVSEKILDLYGKLLAPNGVGYISYNVLPGFYRRRLMRESMLFHIRDVAKPSEMVGKAKAFAQFLSENTFGSPLYSVLLKSEFEGMAGRDESNIYHDDLFTFNNPYYFSDFIGRAGKCGLQFLSEAGRPTFMPADLPQEVLEFIENNSKSVIETEQYIDLFAGAKFRKTLVCRAGVSLNRGLDTDVVKQFFLSSPLRRYTSRAAAADNETVKFVTDSGSVFETDHKLTVTALNRFAVDKSHEIAFEDLVFGSRDELIQKGFSCDDWDSEIATTLSILLQLYAGGLIRFHVARSAALNYVPEKPRISDFARLQASKGGRVPTYHGVNMLLSDDFTKELFVLLDGEKTRDELIAALSAKLYEGNEERSERDAFTEKIAATLDDSLKRMAAIGLLV